jgi:hypothetical protein
MVLTSRPRFVDSWTRTALSTSSIGTRTASIIDFTTRLSTYAPKTAQWTTVPTGRQFAAELPSVRCSAFLPAVSRPPATTMPMSS